MKKIQSLILVLFCVCSAYAQDVISPEDAARKKEINKIKLSEEAVYADVNQPASSPEEAIELSKSRSFTMLQTHVVETIVQDLNMSREDAKKLWNDLESKCMHIVVAQGDIYRVFTYIMRSSIISGGETEAPAEMELVAETTIQPEAVVPVTQPVDSASVVAEVVQPVAQPVDSVTVAQVQPETPVTQPVDSVAMAQAQPVAPVSQPVDSTALAQVQALPVAQPVAVVQPVPVVQPEPEPEPEPEIEIEIPAICQTMMDKGNMSDLMRYLNQEKNYQRLMYGNSSTMQYPEKCYIVIIDKDTREIVSLLDKGQRERMNFITKQMDRYSNYRKGNYAAVFVQEY